MINSLQNSFSNAGRKIYTSIFSAPTKTQFNETGRLTPEEFVRAGDQLVSSCPSWQWKPAKDEKHKKTELPADKQFLFTEVTCEKRVKDAVDTKLIERDLGDGWSVTGSIQEDMKTESIKPLTLSMDDIVGVQNEIQELSIKEEEGEYVEQEIDGMIVRMKVNKAESKIEESNVREESKIENTFEQIDSKDKDPLRKYHLTITYDFYYLTPRMWMVGYDSEGNLLTEKEMYEDIMDEYANKTVTYEYHPHLGMNQLSIHPCKHADVMKHLIDVASDNGIKVEVHHAMFIFLKFISSVVPTMEYDFTVDFEFGVAGGQGNEETNGTQEGQQTQ